MKILVSLLMAIFILSGCGATQNPPLYYYGAYPSSVYQFLKADELSTAEQIEQMKLVIATTQENGQAVAPGVHAHLAMLYFENGNPLDGEVHFTKEKTLFPESANFIDFLLSQHKG
ncbi:MAG: DUF4810 domain-containing protein [Glaciecola sp.]|jgi:hypothetical protein